MAVYPFLRSSIRVRVRVSVCVCVMCDVTGNCLYCETQVMLIEIGVHLITRVNPRHV